MKQRLFTLLLAVLLLLPLSACDSLQTTSPAGSSTAGSSTTDNSTTSGSTAESKYPAYLNLESERPVVKEGEGEDIVVKVVIIQPSIGGDWEDLWVAKYYKEYLNVNFDVEQILDSALDERKTLLFASGSLPDIMMNLNLNTNDIIKFGQSEGQLLQMDQYINEELTPNLVAAFTKSPEAKGMSTTPDGHIYTLPKINSANNEGGVPRLFVNQTWLDACGLENPRTLDEFIAMAEAFQEKDPGGVGSDHVIPIGGGFKTNLNVGYYFLNALGYVGRSDGVAPAVLNGEAEIPCGNTELFREYLRIMADFYDRGLISKDYFVIDNTEVNAQLTSGRIGVYGEPVYVTGLESWADWKAVYPLTSQWNDTPQWMAPDTVSVGGFALSANTEYPELCLRFVDNYYGQDSYILWIGPVDGSEEAMGYLGQTKNGKLSDNWDESNYPEGIGDLWSYLMGYIGPMPTFGAQDLWENYIYYHVHHKGIPDPGLEKQFDLNNADQQYRATVYDNLMPYIQETFPNVYYLDEETTIRLADLEAVIAPYVEEQVALFISGERPLTEFDNYIEELKSIGFDEYQQIYKDIWANYKKAMS